MLKRYSIWLSLAVVVSACSPQLYKVMEDPTESWRFSYSTRNCYGTCANFSIQLFQNGDLTFKGKNKVQFVGDTLLSGQTELRDAVVAKLKEMKFFSLDSVYGNADVQDLPISTYTFAMKANEKASSYDKIKTVKAQMEIPQELRDFQKWFNQELADLGLL